MRRFAILGVLAATLSFAACGDDDESEPAATVTETTTEDTETITKDEYIERVDSICADYRDTNADLDKQLNQAQDFQAIEEALDEAVPSYERQAGEIQAVPLPAEDDPGASAYSDYLDRALALIHQIQDAVSNQDTGALRTYARDLRQLQGELRGITTTYGFKVCGQD